MRRAVRRRSRQVDDARRRTSGAVISSMSLLNDAPRREGRWREHFAELLFSLIPRNGASVFCEGGYATKSGKTSMAINWSKFFSAHALPALGISQEPTSQFYNAEFSIMSAAQGCRRVLPVPSGFARRVLCGFPETAR